MMAVKLDILKKLSRREKYAVLTAVVFICVFVIFQFVAVPAVKKKSRLKRTLITNMKKLDEMVELKAEYDTIKKNLSEAEQDLNYKKIFIIATIGYSVYLFFYLWFLKDQLTQ